jgi:hypothetical protein
MFYSESSDYEKLSVLSDSSCSVVTTGRIIFEEFSIDFDAAKLFFMFPIL